jgi:Ca2+-binding EF-hand superfamily protein
MKLFMIKPSIKTTASAMQRYPSRWTIYDRDGDGLVSGDELRIADVTESARATLYGPEIITWLGTQLDANANGVIDGSEITTFDNLTTSGDWSRLSETMRLLTGISGGTVGTFSSLDGQTSALQQRLISEDELAYVQATYALRSLPGTGGPVTDGDRVAMAAGGGSDVFITTPSELAAWTSGMDDGSVSRLVACRNMMNSTVTNQILALYPSITGGNTSQKLDKLAILFAGTGFMNEVESTRFSNTKTLWSAEVERPGAFAAYDTNSDGMISPSEFTVYQNQRQGSTGFYAP